MESSNKLKYILSLTLVGLLMAVNGFSQTLHHPYYDVERKVHFGFSMGTNFADVKYTLSDRFYANDSLLRVNVATIPGITLGGICNFHLRERWDIRLIPSLLLSQRNVVFQFSDGLEKTKTIESVYADLPFLLKYKSTRHNNVRLYVLAGGEYAFDIAANEGAEKDFFDPNISFKRQNLFYVYGFGFDLYFPYFKFSPEIRIANGITNILDAHSTVYSNSFSKLRSRMIMISFQFE